MKLKIICLLEKHNFQSRDFQIALSESDSDGNSWLQEQWWCNVPAMACLGMGVCPAEREGRTSRCATVGRCQPYLFQHILLGVFHIFPLIPKSLSARSGGSSPALLFIPAPARPLRSAFPVLGCFLRQMPFILKVKVKRKNQTPCAFPEFYVFRELGC